jgi:preprotein translocase subunit SecD
MARKAIIARLRALALAMPLLLLTVRLAAAAPLVLAVASATVVHDQATGRPALSLSLTAEGAAAFAAFSTAEAGHQIAVTVDGELVMSPRLIDPILGGEISISGDFTAAELADLASRLGAGGVLAVEPAEE